jgi:hypothetical protein
MMQSNPGVLSTSIDGFGPRRSSCSVTLESNDPANAFVDSSGNRQVCCGD